MFPLRTFHSLICRGCGITYKHINPKHQFCTSLCANQSHRKPPCICRQCGKEYRPKQATRIKYCSRDCFFQASKEGKVVNVRTVRLQLAAEERLANRRSLQQAARQKVCVICGKQFQSYFQGGNNIYCSMECAGKSNRRRAKEHGVANYKSRQFICQECGKACITVYGDRSRKFCSSKCVRRHHKRIGKAVRRARVKFLPYEYIDPLKIFERDKWHCKMCKVSTPKRHRGTLRNTAPELDHIIPLALGGSHTWINLQCLCRSCNHKKGATMAEAQLCLV